ncbi:hypothetical protein CCH79_00015655 [Gambusia affinis]|uniref:Complex 1 LYR protein domain-containing protein n=1 Tax=Gambusia affinis TaxID=33528 RepID=A0A315VRC8_GAMAF|nr:hypothetical protein CCH79_00015655 [Gambusia affinis]
MLGRLPGGGASKRAGVFKETEAQFQGNRQAVIIAVIERSYIRDIFLHHFLPPSSQQLISIRTGPSPQNLGPGSLWHLPGSEVRLNWFIPARMALSTRSTVLSLYMRVFRIARAWQAQTGAVSDSEAERRFMEQEARSLFRQNQQLTDPESIRRCIEECEARIEIGLHYRNPYPRAECGLTARFCPQTYLPPLGLATQRGRRLRAQQRLRKQAKPVYLQSHDDT